MSLEHTGTVIHVGSVETFGQSNFSKMVLVVSGDEDSKYPQEIPFEFVGKKADAPAAEGVMLGDRVTIRFDLRGRAGEGQYDGRWFGSVNGWDIKKVNGGARPAPRAEDPNQGSLPADEPLADDDLDSAPF